MNEENYGSLVKKLRIQAGLTQNQVAVSLGVTPGYISNVENNRTAMSLRILTYYARLVGRSLDSLVGELEPEFRYCIGPKTSTNYFQIGYSNKGKTLKNH